MKLYELYEDDHRYYLVMALCTGGELYDELVYKGTFDEEAACEIIHQVLEAIAFCHGRGIAHRDIKPENLLLDSKQRYHVKLVDFGNSHAIEKGQKFNHMVGTAYYIAPEVLLNDYDQKCDLWSLGIILYMMITGRPPFDGKDDREIIRNIRLGEFSMNQKSIKKRSLECKDFIRQLLAIDPKRRMSAQDALAHPWINQRRNRRWINTKEI